MKLKSFFSKYYDLILVVLLSLPAVFIAREISVDWGGDFAMYITEALNISHLQPVTETHYIYNEHAPMLGPPVYPVGFPLLLAPVIFFTGNNIPVLINYMLLMFLFFALILEFFFRQFLRKTTAMILALVIIYNPWTLQFKNEILADIPFALFFLLTIVLYTRKAPSWITGLFMAFTILIKTAGFVLPAGITAYALYMFWKNPAERKTTAKNFLLSSLYALLLIFFVNKIIFHIPSGAGLYAHHFFSTGILHVILSNMTLYIEAFQKFFQFHLNDWQFLGLSTQAILFTFFLVGIINGKKDLLFFVFSTYLLVLLVYPYQLAGLRFLLPVFPIMLYYTVLGFRQIKWNFKVKRPVIVIFLALFLLVQYIPDIITLVKKPVKILPGPMEKTSQETFAYIRKNVGEYEAILFIKPRVLALYTDKNAVCNELRDDNNKIMLLLEKTGTRYLLTNTDEINPALNTYIKENRDKLALIWQNQKFSLYRVVKNN